MLEAVCMIYVRNMQGYTILCKAVLVYGVMEGFSSELKPAIGDDARCTPYYHTIIEWSAYPIETYVLRS